MEKTSLVRRYRTSRIIYNVLCLFLVLFIGTKTFSQKLTTTFKKIKVPGDFSKIQAAIDAATNGDTVLVSIGTYYENIDFKGKNIIVGSLFINSNDTSIISKTIINGNNNGSVVKFISGEDSTAYLIGFSINNGNSSYEGGGIVCSNSSNPILKKLTIYGNFASRYGGGIACFDSDPKIYDCIIKNNRSGDDGGGIACEGISKPIIENAIIENNSALQHGGGIHSGGSWDFSSSPTIKNSIIKGNSAKFGGGVYGDMAKFSIIETLIIDNTSSDYGGGICCFGSNCTPEIVNSTIVSNITQTYGGGIICASGSIPKIVNSIISDNKGNSGIWNTDSQKKPIISYCDVWNNEVENFHNCGENIGKNIRVNVNSDSCDLYYNIQLNPFFVNSDNENYHLQQFSPCVDAGDPSSRPDPDGTIADIGAFYFHQGDNTAPATPKNLQVVPGDHKLILSWSQNTESDLSCYKIYRSKIQGFIPTPNDLLTTVFKPNTSYLDQAVINGQTYYYRISAVDLASNESGFSSEVSATPGDFTAPSIPQNLQANSGDKKVTLTWSPNTESDLAYYKIYRSQIHGFVPNENDSLAVVSKPASSYVDQAVINKQIYYYRILAVDLAGNESGFSSEVSATPGDFTAPSIPQNLQTNSGDKKVTLTWSPNTESDLAFYKIYRSQTHGFVPNDNDSLAVVFKPASSYIDQAVINGQTYYYRISAIDLSANESGFSSEVSATPGDFAAPSIPQNLQANSGDKKITLTWSPNSEPDLSHYKIYRSQTHGFVPSDNNSLAVVFKPTNSYLDQAVINGQTYYYRISAIDLAGNESGFSSEVSATPGDFTAPSIPQNLQANSSDKKVTLTWSPNTESDLAYYKIYRSQTHGFVPGAKDSLAIAFKPTSTYLDQAVINGQTYYYRISAVDNSGNESDFSNEVSATPKANKPTMPKNFQATAGDKKVTLSWSQNPESDLSHYQIYRSQLHGFIPAITDTLTIVMFPDNSYIDTEVINGLTYYYRISAINVAGNESDYSAEASATPQAGITIPNIVVSALEHNFGDVPLLATASWQVIVENQGTANLQVTNVVSDNSVFSVNPNQFNIDPGSRHSVYIRFTPDSLQAERGTVTIFSNDPDQPEFKITLSGKGIDNQAPEIILPTPTATMWVIADYLLTAQIKDNWAVRSAWLFYRNGAQRNFQSLGMSQGQGENYFGAIPGSEVTFAGIAYFIKAEDSAGNTTFSDTISQAIYFQDGVLSTSRIACPYQAGYPRGEWHQISVPALLDQSGAAAVLNDETELGNYGEPNWRLFSYQDTDGDKITDGYVEFRSDLESSVFRFDSGKAFWLKANPDGAKIEIDVGAGHILPLAPQTIGLKPGWNQIGNPFAFPIAFSPNDSRIVNKLYLPDGSGGYQLTTTMQPWAGYFLFVNGNSALDLKLAPVPGNPLNKTIADDAEWMFQINAFCGTSKDEINYFGLSQTSLDEWDSNDYPEPPTIGDFISLYFPHEDWQEHCKNFTTDFRNSIGEGQIWNLMVTTNQKSSEVNLSWSQLKIADENLEVQLYDCNRNKTIDMEKASDYRFSRLNQETNSPFQILVGNRDFIERQVAEIQSRLPNEFCLFQNYPNPFNSTTQIRFQLPSFQKVSLKILNVMGREVRALLNEDRAAGIYQIFWDGKDNQGNEAGTGVYLCVFQAGQYAESRKVLVLK